MLNAARATSGAGLTFKVVATDFPLNVALMPTVLAVVTGEVPTVKLQEA